jgi:hypothetical protein
VPRIRRLLAWAAIVAGIVLVAVFGVRGWQQYQFAQRVASGQIQVESLRGWMTLPYVARLYGVPERRLRDALGVAASGGDERSLREWFELAGLQPQDGRQRLEAVILQARGTPSAP